jgi:hypothetical protein
VTHLKRSVAAVSIGSAHRLRFGLPVACLVAARDPTDIGGPEAVSGYRREGTGRL